MKKYILIGLITVIIIGATVLCASGANAQVSGSLWKISLGTLLPINSTWTLTLPYLPNKNCIGTDANGLLQTGTCSSGSTGLGTTSPWVAGQVASVVNNSTLTSVATGTVSNGTGISVTAGQSIIGSGLTITNTGVTSVAANSPLSTSAATGGITLSCATCSTFGNSWQLISNIFGVTALAPTTTVPIAIQSTATSTFTGPIESWNNIAAPYLEATSSTATSTLLGGLSVGSTAFEVLQNGNVGVGTAVPAALFQVGNTSAGNIRMGTSGGVAEYYQAESQPRWQITRDSVATGDPGILFRISGTQAANGAAIAQPASNALSFYTSDGANNLERVRINNVGNFGIGTTSPWAKLSVMAGGTFASQAPSTVFAIGSTTAGTATTTFMVVNSDGRVGIGTTSPVYPLDVAGFINTDQYSGYKQNGNTVLYATTTSSNLAIGASGAAAWMSATSSDTQEVAIGVNALNTTPTGANGAFNNVAIGKDALKSNTAGRGNFALGTAALTTNTTGSSNVAIGLQALTLSDGSDSNIAIGASAMLNATTPFRTTGIGNNVLFNNTSPANEVAIGWQSGYGVSGAYSSVGDTLIGYGSGRLAIQGHDYNTLIGFNGGTDVSSGADNILIGATQNSGGNHLTTGSNNICISFNCILPGGTSAANQLNIGNVIFGTGLTATSSSTSIPGTLTGLIGIGSTSPWRTFSVVGTMAVKGLTSTSGGDAVCINTTTFDIQDSGGSTCVASSKLVKGNVVSITSAEALHDINGLNPVVYTDLLSPTGQRYFGFIADDVQKIDPKLVVLAPKDEQYTLANGTKVTVKKGQPASFDYLRVTALITKEVKDILARLDGDEKKLNDQEKEIQAQQKEIDTLTSRLDDAGL